MFAIARRDSDGRVVNGVASVVLAAVLIGTIYVGREVFVPITLAILLSFVLAPFVRILERWFQSSVSSCSRSQASFSSVA